MAVPVCVCVCVYLVGSCPEGRRLGEGDSHQHLDTLRMTQRGEQPRHAHAQQGSCARIADALTHISSNDMSMGRLCLVAGQRHKARPSKCAAWLPGASAAATSTHLVVGDTRSLVVGHLGSLHSGKADDSNEVTGRAALPKLRTASGRVSSVLCASCSVLTRRRAAWVARGRCAWVTCREATGTRGGSRGQMRKLLARAWPYFCLLAGSTHSSRPAVLALGSGGLGNEKMGCGDARK